MVKTFDSEVKSTRKYAKILLVIAVVFALVIGSFVIYSCVYFNTKNKLEGNFTQQLKENNFHKNRNGYYSMSDSDGIIYSVPNQSMPGLLDFSLQFHISNVYCDIDLEDTIVEIVWEDNNEFTASAISKDDNKIVGSTSEFTESDFMNMKKLGNELGIPEREMTRIIEREMNCIKSSIYNRNTKSILYLFGAVDFKLTAFLFHKNIELLLEGQKKEIV